MNKNETPAETKKSSGINHDDSLIEWKDLGTRIHRAMNPG